MTRRRKLTGAVVGAVAGGAAVAVAAVVALGSTSSSAAGPGSPGSGSQGGAPARLAVSGGYIPRPLLTDMAAAYLTVRNTAGGAAELTAVTSPLAAHVTLHTTVGTTMRQVMSLPVPAGGSLTLGLGADHLMLENLTRRPAVGDKVTLTLHFTHATPATVTITVPVRPTTYRPGG
ncbi:MAG TPA: copper chaperone PCu(A)C [Streptomyces sp.]